MTKRDQFGAAFCAHDAGDACGGQHIAFRRLARADQIQRLRPHRHPAFCRGFPYRLILGRNIDHAGMARRIEMGKAAQAVPSSVRRAKVTSG